MQEEENISVYLNDLKYGKWYIACATYQQEALMTSFKIVIIVYHIH